MGRIRIIIFLFLAVCIVNTESYSQKLPIPDDAPRRAVKEYEKGRQSEKEGKLHDAITHLSKAIEKFPDFQSAKILKASILYKLKDFSQAEIIFENVINSNLPFHPKVYLTTGIIQYKLDKFSKATESLKTYLSNFEMNSDLEKKAKRYLMYSEFAADAVLHPLEFAPMALENAINSTEFNEYAPSITADGQRMVFTRRAGGFEYLFESKKVNGVWQKAKPLDKINSHLEGGAHSISADGRFIVFTNCERRYGFGSCDLFYSRYKRGVWTKPRNMGLPINSSAWDSQPSLADNGRTLYFSSNRKGTIGAKDIWVARRLEDNSWSHPQNLGTDINTVNDEKAPFMHFDAKSLYYMSKGLPGMGDFDLYYTKRKEDTIWSPPVNLGYPINTKFQEGTLFVDLYGKKGYITSDRHHADALNKEYKYQIETDIYEFDMPGFIAPLASTFLEIHVLDKKTGKSIQADISLAEYNSEKALYKGKIQEDGYELICLPLGTIYAVQVSFPGYTFFSERIKLKKSFHAEKPMKYVVELEKTQEIVEDIPVILKNVLFRTGSAELLMEADEEINFLSQWLENNHDADIEIRGHTDNVGDEVDNKELSERRALAVVNALKEKGVKSSRMTWKGYGEEQPIAENNTEQGRKANRRTELVLKNK